MTREEIYEYLKVKSVTAKARVKKVKQTMLRSSEGCTRSEEEQELDRGRGHRQDTAHVELAWVELGQRARMVALDVSGQEMRVDADLCGREQRGNELDALDSPDLSHRRLLVWRIGVGALACT